MPKSTREQIDEAIESAVSNRRDYTSYSNEKYIIKLKELLDNLEEEAFTRGIQAEYLNS